MKYYHITTTSNKDNINTRRYTEYIECTSIELYLIKKQRFSYFIF